MTSFLLKVAAITLATPALAFAAESAAGGGPNIAGIPLEFILFGLTLLCVALFHHYTLQVALTGLVVISAYKLFHGFDYVEHVKHEGMLLLNLFGLLVGFGLLADYFARSRIPDKLPAILPNDWKGGFALLALVFVLSSFLDNIAAAMIGGTVAAVVFNKRVHIGYLAAIVAASNAGGAGSVVGDTTTTMMWIAGKSPMDVLHAFVASTVALFAFGIIAAKQQDAYQRIQKDSKPDVKVDSVYLVIVVLILAGAILANVYLEFPAAGVWAAILIAIPVRRPNWHEIPVAAKGSLFLLSLVMCASMMPVEKLPSASWETTLGLGFVSAVFDNIPLTKLALDQGGYDWGFLAYAVGFGGSMIWFGSSAGVAISNTYPEAKSAGLWLKHGWHVVLAYVVGFFAMYFILGWHPHEI
jgi:Na+/H+ antiporter NhaD/arsenite permease-like protein